MIFDIIFEGTYLYDKVSTIQTMGENGEISFRAKFSEEDFFTSMIAFSSLVKESSVSPESSPLNRYRAKDIAVSYMAAIK